MDASPHSESPHIRPPQDADDAEGAIRVFNEFLGQYQHVLVTAEQYFDQIRQQVNPQFAAAYAPWQKAVKDLLQGVYLVARKIPLRDSKNLADALRQFSLDSAVSMLHDVCVSCKVKLANDWVAGFKHNVQVLGNAFRVLMQQKVIGLAR